MADSKPNNQNNDIANMTDSHADFDDAAKILVAMYSSGGTSQTSPEMSTLEHAAAQGAPALTPSQAATSSAIPAPAAITYGGASIIVDSIENDDGEGQTAHTSSNDTIRASRAPTTLVTSDTRSTSDETSRGIVERVLVTPERTMLSGRVEHGLSARQREKQPATPSGQEVEAEQAAEHNDPVGIDTHDNANVAQNEDTDTKSLVVVLPATQWYRLQAQAQAGPNGSKPNATDESGNRKPESDKGKGKAPADDQTNNATTMVEPVERASLRGGTFPDDSPPPTHKPSKAPLRAQTTTALHFLQTTANPETAEDLARRAELNNANELARRIGVRASVRQVGPLPGLNFAIVDLEASIHAVRAATQRENRDQPATSAPGASSSAVADAPAPARPHTTFTGVYIHTARCDNCDSRNQSVLFRCKDCSNQLCRPCMEEDPIHRTDGLDWTDHGAQSASKPRSNPGAPRQRRLKVDKQRPKPKPTGKGPATKVIKTKATVAQNRVRFGVMNLNSPRNSPAGVAVINAIARRLQNGTDGADDEDDEDDEAEDEDEVEFMWQSSRPCTGMGARNMGMSAIGGGPAIGMGGGSVLGKRSREPRIFERRHPFNFNPFGASVTYAGPGNFQPPRASPPSAGRVILHSRSPRAGPSTVQPPQQIKQESEEEVEFVLSVYDRKNKAKEAKAEKERAAKRHKAPVDRGVGLSQERVSQEHDEESGTERGTPASALQASRRPAITSRSDCTATIRTSALARNSLVGQNYQAQAGRAPRSASSAGISPAVHGFLARTDHLRSDYTRVTNEEAELEEQLARIKAKKAKIEKGFRDLMK